MIDVRCPKCNKFLMKMVAIVGNKFEIKCARCKSVVDVLKDGKLCSCSECIGKDDRGEHG